MHKPPTRFRPWLVVLAVSVWATASGVAQDKYTWNNSGSSSTATAWLTPSNWTLNPNDQPPTPSTHYPGRVPPNNTGNGQTEDIAYFGSTLPSNSPTAVGINMASAGTGSMLHVAGELFKMMAGVEMVHIPYRGTAPALSDLLF